MRFVLVLFLALAACHHDPQPTHANPGDLPPLPPASGTPVGYLIDSSGDLKLTEDQLEKLKNIDASLAARNADIDTQLRQIEKPEEEEQLTPQEQKAGKRKPRYNNAPGQNVQTNADAAKLHDLHNANDKAALKEAWAILDPQQQSKAKQILEARGVDVPGADKKQTGPNPDDGKPLPGMEP